MRTALTLLGLAASAAAHFVLSIPTSLGWDDDLQPNAPCGGFAATDRTNVTQFPVKGAPVGLITTHDESVFEFKAAKLSDPTKWINLTATLHQIGEGDFCEPLIPGPKDWIGQDAVLQIIQTSEMGVLYQCAAIKFTDGNAASKPSGCTNSTTISAKWA